MPNPGSIKCFSCETTCTARCICYVLLSKLQLFFFDVFFSPSVLEKHTVESRLSEPQISGCSDYLGGISVGFN